MTRERPSIATVMMRIAAAMAERSTCSSRAMVGAVLASTSGVVLSTGYNGAPSGLPHCDDVGCSLDEGGHCVRSIHAEDNAIIQCAKYGRSTVGAVLYSTHHPCARCAVKVVQAGVVEVHYARVHGSVEEEAAKVLREAGVRVFKERSG